MKCLKKVFIQIFLCIFLASYGLEAQIYQPEWQSLDSRPIPTWFQEAKFGIFIHWGVYSVPAWRMLESERYASYAEWYYARVMENDENGGREFHEKNYGKDFDYHAFGPLFRAELWDPKFWAETFRQAGAKYVVLTSKHHDGYCLWPTDVVYKKDWNSMDVGPHRDIVGELSRAVRAEGLRMGLYYSVPDWESVPRGDEYQVNMKYVKKYGVDLDTYVNEICNPQLRELVNKYEPSLIFSDAGEWQFDDEFWGTKEFLAWLYNESPVKDEVVVNDRFCKGMPGNHGDYFSSEYADAEIKDHPWEESRGIGGSYGFNRAENLDDYQTSEELIEELINIVSRGGNLLLNVGPAADGRIPVIQQQRLRDIGEWLEVNGEAIYGCTKPDGVGLYPTPYIDDKKADNVYFTARKNNLYVICATYPADKLVIEGLTSHEVLNITMLGYEKEINWSCDGEMCIIKAPCIYPSELPCQHAWVFRIESQAEHGNSDKIDIPLGVCTNIANNGGLRDNYASAMGMEPFLLEEFELPKITVESGSNTGADPLTNAHMKNWMECVRKNDLKTNAPIEAGYSHSIANIMVTAALRTGERAVFNPEKRQVLAGGKKFKY